MDKSKFGTPAYKGGKDMRRSLDKVQEQSQMTSLLPLYTSNSHSILRHTHPENPLYAQRAFSCVQFNCDIRIKDFQNYNSNIDFSLKIITTFLDFHKDGFKINPEQKSSSSTEHVSVGKFAICPNSTNTLTSASPSSSPCLSNHILPIPIPAA